MTALAVFGLSAADCEPPLSIIVF